MLNSIGTTIHQHGKCTKSNTQQALLITAIGGMHVTPTSYFTFEAANTGGHGAMPDCCHQSRSYLQPWQERDQLIGRHSPEIRTLQCNPLISQNTTLACNMPGGVDVITSHHTDKDTGMLAGLHSIRDLSPAAAADSSLFHKQHIALAVPGFAKQ